MNEETTRAGFVALIGAPNAGKSTLLNSMLGQKVAIVTRKVQTTRSQLRGVCMAGTSQIIFIDTPGIFEPRRRLDRAMVHAAWTGAGDADQVVLLVDAQKGVDAEVASIIESLGKTDRKAILALNKIDKIKREYLLALAAELNESGVFTDTFMISALKGRGIGDLRSTLAARMPPGPWLYPPDQLTDITERLLAAEVTREKLYLRLHQELPYQSTVETETFEERKDGSARIQQVIFVERDSQKSIVLGKRGQMIKAIGAEARAELQDLLDRKVHLFLFVKVRENWGNDPERYVDWGLDFKGGG